MKSALENALKAALKEKGSDIGVTEFRKEVDEMIKGFVDNPPKGVVINEVKGRTPTAKKFFKLGK
jgi:hypothetical protein